MLARLLTVGVSWIMSRGIAPTGKRAKWTQISIVRFVGGRVAEDWAVADELSILQQIGGFNA